jgi:hypothetical protein
MMTHLSANGVFQVEANELWIIDPGLANLGGEPLGLACARTLFL